MPTEDEHFAQAEKNERLCQLLSSPGFPGETFHDWQVTTLFYSALHYVDAVLANKSLSAGNHRLRGGHVANLAELKPITSKYLNLHLRSENARYHLTSFPREEVERIERDVFRPLKAHLCTLLGRP